MEKPHTPHLDSLSREIDNLYRDENYWEWRGPGEPTVSHLFDHRSRVDFNRPAQENKDAYLSVSQLKLLMLMPAVQRYEAYVHVLTGPQLALIDRFEAIYNPPPPEPEPEPELEPEPEPEPPQLRPATATPIPGLSTAVEPTRPAPAPLWRQVYQNLEGKWSGLSPDFKKKLAVGVGALSLAAVSLPILAGTRIAENTEMADRYVAAPAAIAPVDGSSIALDVLPESAPTGELLRTASDESAGQSFSEASQTSEEPPLVRMSPLRQSPQPAAEAAVDSQPAEASPEAEVSPADSLPNLPEVAATDEQPSEEEGPLALLPETDLEEEIDLLPEDSLAHFSATPSVNSEMVDSQLRQPSAAAEPKESQTSVETDPPQTPPPDTVQESSAYTGPVASLTAEQAGWLRAAGIGESDWGFVDYIFTRESHWRPYLWNQQGSSAYGICQRMMSVWPLKEGERYMDDPVAQVIWCDWYAHERYGSWENAYNAWRKKKWW